LVDAPDGPISSSQGVLITAQWSIR